VTTRQHVNPYIAGSPVTGTEMFYGREDVFSFIRRNLIGRHRDTPVVLYGQRRTGKTSVLYQLHRHLDPKYRCVFIDLHGLNLDGMGNLLLGIASAISRGLRHDHKLTVSVPDRSSFLTDPRQAFEAAYLDEVWSALGAEDHLVLMMDEVVRLDEEVKAGRLERDIFDYLRHLMQHHKRLNFIFSLGSGLEEMAKDYAFLFSVSLYRRISFLEETAARELIVQPARDHYEVAPQAVEKILQITSGHPYYTQLVCHCLFDSWSRSPRPVLDVVDVEAVLTEAIELGSANLTYVWRDSTATEQALMAGMAAVMRHQPGAVTPGQVRDRWKMLGVALPEREAVQAFKSLNQREVTEGGDPAYSFAVDLQRLWLEKHRHLDWVKEEIAETTDRWNRAAETWPADAVAAQSGKREVPAAGDGTDGTPAGSARAARRRIVRRGPYLMIAVCAVLLAGYLAASAAAGIFPFARSGSSPLMQLLAADLSQNGRDCRSTQAPSQWSTPGLVQALKCNDPRLKGGSVYGYQLSSEANFRAAWQSFNQWWGFLSASAGKECPPHGTAQGVITSADAGLGQANQQVQECALMTLSAHKTVPAYAWDFPDVNAFLVAEGATGAPFSALDTWLNPPPPGRLASPSRSASASPAPAAERSQAVALARLLAFSTKDRTSVVNAVNDISSCGTNLSQDAQVLTDAARARQEAVSLLSTLSALPSGMLSALAGAWQNSSRADQDFAAWAHDKITKGCTVNDRSDPRFQAASRPDDQATTDKQAFARQWLPIAAKYGLPTYQVSKF
jgi:AAA domain-containing protein